eukprot:1276301-Rhodomonas_salina.1
MEVLLPSMRAMLPFTESWLTRTRAQAKQAAIPLRLKSNPPLEKSGPPPEPEPTTTDGAEAKRTRKEEGGASGILGGGGVDLNQWELAQQRAGASGGVSETVMESFQVRARNLRRNFRNSRPRGTEQKCLVLCQYQTARGPYAIS